MRINIYTTSQCTQQNGAFCVSDKTVRLYIHKTMHGTDGLRIILEELLYINTLKHQLNLNDSNGKDNADATQQKLQQQKMNVVI